jgi:hypothetical protein
MPDLWGWFNSVNWTANNVTAAATVVLACMTVFLAFGTLFLWCATRKLVKVSREAARQQMRAYVGLGTKGLYSTDNKPKMQITNFGATPAMKAMVWRKIVDAPPTVFDYTGDFYIEKNIMIQPRQDIHVFWGKSMEERDGRFLYGYIEYTDIHGKRWRSRFAYQHRGCAWYTRHDEHNDEIEITKPWHYAISRIFHRG